MVLIQEAYNEHVHLEKITGMEFLHDAFQSFCRFTIVQEFHQLYVIVINHS